MCPITITKGERWKMGQLKAGDKLRFVRVTEDSKRVTHSGPVSRSERIGVLHELPETPARPLVRYRRAGDEYVLVEYGPESAGTALFPTVSSVPRVTGRMFSSQGLQRVQRGQAGAQRFFTLNGRAFCLYTVVGDQREVGAMATTTNDVTRQIEVTPA